MLLVISAILLGLVGTVLVAAGILALKRARPLSFGLRTLLGLLLIAVGALAAGIGVGMKGYRALTYEAVAARIAVEPAGRQRFTATVRIPDRPDTTYEIAGDQIYIDAHILKWKPLVNVLGLHTAYELSRIAGRYGDIEQEQVAERTVYSLVPDRPVNLFDLRQRYAFLSPLLDAEYGSGTFVPVRGPAELEVRVSTSGLLIRHVEAGQD